MHKVMTEEKARKQEKLLALIDRSSLDDILIIYADRFSENYPTMCFQGKSEAEIIGGVKQCLINNKPCVVDIPLEWDV